MSQHEFLCPSEALPEGEYHELHYSVAGTTRYLVATRVDGQVQAWYNRCPHAGQPLNRAPDEFLTDEHNRLICAAHGAVFDPRSGQCVAGPCPRALLTRCPVVEEDGQVFAADEF